MSVGHHGREALRGEYESAVAIYITMGDFVPKPIAQDTFQRLQEQHFYICKFYNFVNALPEPSVFCAKLAALHANSVSPNGKFGFHVTTYVGNLPQENTWQDTWEEFFTKGFTHMVGLAIDRGGPWDEIENLYSVMVSRVIPRLLRPLETNGLLIKPCLIHGNLGNDNVDIDAATGLPIIYNPASFYAHNECEQFHIVKERGAEDSRRARNLAS